MLQQARFEVFGHVGRVEINDAATKARVSVAVNVSWKDDANVRHERTDWFDLAAFKNRVDFVKNYVTAGRYVRVSGTMRPNKYEKDGQTHYTYDLIADQIDFLDSPPQA